MYTCAKLTSQHWAIASLLIGSTSYNFHYIHAARSLLCFFYDDGKVNEKSDMMILLANVCYLFFILSINHLAPLGKSDYATLQVNITVSELPTGNLSKPKWRYKKANVPGHLCAANGIDWVSVSQITHVDDQWYHIKKTFLLLLDRCVPFGPTSRRRTLPWLRAKHKCAQISKLLLSSSTRIAHRLIYTVKNQIWFRNC